jgi:hypothetical protein
MTDAWKIVDENSAVMGVSQEEIIPMPGSDHRTICRFSSINESDYNKILAIISKYALDALDSTLWSPL